MSKKSSYNTQVKTKHAKAKQTSFNQQVSAPVIAQYIALLKRDLQKLKALLFQWSGATGKLTYYGKKDVLILRDYIQYQHDYYQYDQFDSSFEIIPNLNNVNLSQISDESLIFKSFKLFKTPWPIRFNTKFVGRLNDYQLDQIYYVLGFVYYLANGNFGGKPAFNNNWGYARSLMTKTVAFNRFFAVKIFKEKNMFVHVGVEKVPVIKNGVIKRYEYQQYMNFLDVLGDMYVENHNKLEERLNVFREQIFGDVAKKDHSEELEVDMKEYSKKNVYFHTQIFNQYTQKSQFYDTSLSEYSVIRYAPLKFKPNYISTAEMSTMIFDENAKRWLSKDHLNYMERKKIAEYQKQISDSLIKRFVDFQSAKVLVELLTKIPNFKVNLTEQEKDVIGENGNVLAIGRSGTGKTTCAVLRLFSIEMLFKIRVSIYKKKYEQTVKDVRCGSNDIDDTLGLHCIFLTASPVLTHEIQRYYKKLTDNIKTELERKKKKLQEEKKIQEERKKIEQKEAQQEMSFQQLNESSQVEEQIKEKQEKIDKPEVLGEKEDVIPDTLSNKKSVDDLEEEDKINEQFKDIELKEEVGNEGFNEEEEDIDELKMKFEENIKKYHNLYDLEEKDYPGFFTVKSFIMMIDGVLPKPFFIRSKSSIINQDSQASWHNERKGVMMIENYYKSQEEQQKYDINDIEEEINYSDEEQLEHEYLRQIQLRQNKEKQQLTKKLQQNKSKQIMSFEVDYDYFIVHFWPRIVKKFYSTRNITPHLVWTEIYSTIKGSAAAHQYPAQFLTELAYIDSTSNTFLTRDQKKDIYEAFCQYERWKIRAGGYDIMDAVNYILNYIRFRSYQGPELHYVMIDQVQDLPHAIVYLFSKIATYGVFYSGDTAQTIAKGVGFRFCDLKSLFNPKVFDASIQLKTPAIKHLTINFRSHNNILQLANSVVSSIEMLFPKTIDRMKKEISDLSGPKPMILSSSDQELLFYVLCGGQEKKMEEGTNAVKKSPLEFGCDQVIIVRDQESKNRVPPMLQHALCLTIYEAKGLQFNDVILFNFFTESPCVEKWSLLKSLDVISVDVPKEQYEKHISRRKQKEQKDEEAQEQEVNVDEKFNKETNSYRIRKIATNKHNTIQKDINDYAELCSELKLLYTAITRPRKTLIIYDEGECPARSTIERIWERLDVIEVINKQYIIDATKKGSEKEEVKIFNKIITATDSNSWKQQGLKMYARGYFDQAMKCFERSGHKDLFKKAEANKNADDATKKLIEIESEKNAIKQGFHTYRQMNANEVSKIKKKLKKEENQAIASFEVAGKLFEDLLMFKQAGQCYFSGKLFEKAYECFCKAFMNKQAAESLEMLNKYREASEYYEKDDNYLKVVQCLDLVNEWALILEKIHKFSHKMSDYEKQALLKKYSALALEQLVYEIEFENDEEHQKPQNNRVEVIEEKQSDEEDEWDSDEDPQLAAERQYQRKISSQISDSNPSRKASEVDESREFQIKQSVYQTLGQSVKPSDDKVKGQKGDVSSSFADLNESKEQGEKPKQQLKSGPKSVEMSFSDLNDSSAKLELLKESTKQGQQQKIDIQSLESSFSQLNAKYDSEMEPDIESIKSMIDPDDNWVKNSISEIGHKLHSQYSVIDDEEENYNLNVKIIKTKGNIFVQDEIMKKIINIVSIINSSVHQFFKQFKGYQSLITVSKPEDAEEDIDSRPQITQFQDIDPKFINIILDTLESFKLFKLCLFVCNRYHLPAKAGRYLISLGLKYSTNCCSNNSVNPILLAPSNFRKTQIEKGILASIALHAIYQNVNADFLKIKVTDREEDNKHSLGLYFIQGLILEGLYKKAIFMVNPQEALKIASNYNDFGAYRNIYQQKLLKKQEIKEQLQFPCQLPKKSHQIQFTRILLKKIIFELSVANKFESVSLRYYKQFGHVALPNLQNYKVPEYLPYTKLLIEKKEQFADHFRLLLEKGYVILTKGTELQVLDFVAAFLLTTHSEDHQHAFIKYFENDDFLEYYRCAKHIELVLKKFKGANAISILQSVFYVHQCYIIKHCKSMSFVNDIYCFVQRTSTVANELVDNPKVQEKAFAFFFEQDYNLILAKVSKVSRIITKKYEHVLVKLYTKRRNYFRYTSTELPEYFIAHEEEQLIRKALDLEIDILTDAKEKKKNAKKEEKKKSKEKILSYEFKNRGKDRILMNVDESSDSQPEDLNMLRHNQFSFFRPNFNTKLAYMAPLMLEIFLEHSKNAKEIVDGRELYGSGLNHYYREYTCSKGGYNLFDAIEFKKFKRVDLYAENLLSVMDNLTLYSKHNYVAQILTLLLVQYKARQESKGFCLRVTKNELKYLQGLKFKKSRNSEVTQNNPFVLLANNQECIFEYANQYVSEMSKSQLANIICDYLDILKEEEMSKFVNFGSLILSYVINIDSDEDISDSLRVVINFYGQYWGIETLKPLIESRTLRQYLQNRKALIEAQYKTIYEGIHSIQVQNTGNLDKAIDESQIDYQIQGKILDAKKKAASKIIKWWKGKRLLLKKQKKQGNYLQLAVESSLLKKQASKPDAIKDIRYSQSIYNDRNIFQQIDLLLLTCNIKEQLLSFLLTKTISSSLDFHFVLMSLNKVEQCRQKYFQFCSWDQAEIHEFDIAEVKDEVEELVKTINIWKNDQKWMRDKNLNLKKKKVFEVKWMTKNLHLSNIIKKRAGLKKQDVLQKKKQMLKRMK